MPVFAGVAQSGSRMEHVCACISLVVTITCEVCQLIWSTRGAERCVKPGFMTPEVKALNAISRGLPQKLDPCRSQSELCITFPSQTQLLQPLDRASVYKRILYMLCSATWLLVVPTVAVVKGLRKVCERVARNLVRWPSAVFVSPWLEKLASSNARPARRRNAPGKDESHGAVGYGRSKRLLTDRGLLSSRVPFGRAI